jgi:hypothetical protein
MARLHSADHLRQLTDLARRALNADEGWARDVSENIAKVRRFRR